MSALFGDVYITNVVEPPKPKQELVESEVLQFKREPPINANESALKWWKTHSDKYPTLALVAKKVPLHSCNLSTLRECVHHRWRRDSTAVLSQTKAC